MTNFDAESRDKLMSQLQRHEGSIKDKDGWHIAYKCPARKVTIGYGHNLEALPIEGLDEDSRINEGQALFVLREDMKQVEEQVLREIPFSRDLDSVRLAVLINMAFNMGIKGLCGFKNTLKFIANRDYVSASSNMLKSKWATQVGGRAKELAEQMRTGQWA